jgi:transcription elongation factor Elf1
MKNFQNTYNPDGKQKRFEARAAAGFHCIRCGSPSVKGRILTVHHFDGDKSNDAWWNLLALCQVCHLKVQAKVDPQVPWFLEHSEWMKPYVAGFYAKKYEGHDITREEAIERMEELLAYELAGGKRR